MNEEYVRQIDPNWDRETLMAEMGVFLLVDICRVLDLVPTDFTDRLRGRDNRKLWLDYGILKAWKAWMVRMPDFGQRYPRILEDFPIRPKGENTE